MSSVKWVGWSQFQGLGRVGSAVANNTGLVWSTVNTYSRWRPTVCQHEMAVDRKWRARGSLRLGVISSVQWPECGESCPLLPASHCIIGRITSLHQVSGVCYHPSQCWSHDTSSSRYKCSVQTWNCIFRCSFISEQKQTICFMMLKHDQCLLFKW